MLFSRESDIDAIHKLNFFSEETLEKLVKQKFALEKQRDNMLRNIIALAFLMYLVSNGQSMVLPFLKIDLASIPGLQALLGLLMAVHILFAEIAGINVGAYSGLIEEFSKRKSNDTVIDPDLVTASVVPFQMFLKILRVRFNIYHPVHIVPHGFCAFMYAASIFVTMALIFSFIALVYLYTAYFLAFEVPNSYFGIGAKTIGYIALVATALIHIAANWEFKQTVTLGPLEDE